MPDPTAPETSTADTTTTPGTTTAPATGSATTDVSTDALPDSTTSTETTTETTTDADTTVPDAYVFDMPEGVTLDQTLLDKATPTFQELGLTNAEAAKLVSIYAERMTEMTAGGEEAFNAAYTERAQADVAQRKEQWIEQAKADKEIGGSNFEPVKSRVMDAIGAVGTPEAKQAFNEQGWGNHPELIRTFNRLIDYIPEDKGERPAGGGGTKSMAERLWPNANK